MELTAIQRKDTLLPTKKLARVAETSSIKDLGKIKISALIEGYGKNATLANFQTVMRQLKRQQPTTLTVRK